jgi:hypothetical protein
MMGRRKQPTPNPNNMIAIQVSITRNTKPYIGRITGPDAKYGFALDFLALKRHSAKYHTGEITAPGLYKLAQDATVGARGIDTGYITVTEDGTVTEITKEEAQSLAQENA